MPQPIQRHEALQPLSREHHFGLLLSWKIREGFRKNIDLKRIKAYLDWAWEKVVTPHIQFEEKYLFPILPPHHGHVKKALAEHRRLERLFGKEDELEISLSLLEEELEQHIRFEERVLFNEIQEVATPEMLRKLEELHGTPDVPTDWNDPFWKTEKE